VPNNSKLNLIIITSDEMRADAIGCLGNPVCRTPHIDRLAKKGVLFTNHFTVHGKCVPSRIAMQNGRYPHTDGYRTINLHMPVEQPSLAKTLKTMGYEFAYLGHNHVWENNAFWGVDNKKGTSFPDYHSYTAEYMWPLLDKKHPVQQPGPDSLTPMNLSNHGCDYGGRKEEPLTGFVDDNRADQAIHYLRTIRDRSRPFYLHLNYGAPHPAYRVEEPYFSMYPRDSLDSYPHDLPKNAPLHLEVMRTVRAGEQGSDEAFNEIQAVYYGMVTKVDTLVGRVVDELEAQGLFDNSIVIFTNDHGDFAGQYGQVEKWDTAMCDCIMRSPFILCAPGLKDGASVNSLTEHVDVPSTVLELLGSAPDWGVHGQSMLPAISGERAKEAVFGDGGHEEEMWGRFGFGKEQPGKPLNGKQVTYRDYPQTMARTKMVRTEKWKLVVRLTGGNELYDMEQDPKEMNNLYPDTNSSPALQAVVSDLQLKLLEWCLRTDTDQPRDNKVGA
jgi:arylsulfatase A-like enzyme